MEMETAAGDGGEGPWPEHFDGADGATTKNGMHPRREYDNVVLEAMERGQDSTGGAAGEDSHGATETCAGWIKVEEGGRGGYIWRKNALCVPFLYAKKKMFALHFYIQRSQHFELHFYKQKTMDFELHYIYI